MYKFSAMLHIVWIDIRMSHRSILHSAPMQFLSHFVKKNMRNICSMQCTNATKLTDQCQSLWCCAHIIGEIKFLISHPYRFVPSTEFDEKNPFYCHVNGIACSWYWLRNTIAQHVLTDWLVNIANTHLQFINRVSTTWLSAGVAIRIRHRYYEFWILQSITWCQQQWVHGMLCDECVSNWSKKMSRACNSSGITIPLVRFQNEKILPELRDL